MKWLKYINAVVVPAVISIILVFYLGQAGSNRGSAEEELKPIDRDLSEIVYNDTLRIITRNHPLTYYLYRGSRRGFDYELIKKFAEEQGLFLEVIVPPRWIDMIPYLYEGKGDIITSMMTVTPEREEKVDFTRSYMEVWQVAVGTDNNPPPMTLDELNGRTVLVRKGSSYQERLQELVQQGLDIRIEVLDDSVEIIEPVELVAQGLVPLSVVDNTIARLEEQFFPGLVEGVKLTEAQNIAWAVRPNSPELKEALNEFLTRYYRSAYFNILKKRYFENKNHFLRHRSAQLALARQGQISKYDDIFRAAAEETGFDWRLLAAQSYHESRFYRDNTSWSGAVGLMQLMPRTAEVMGVTDIYDPWQNIFGGARYLRILFDLYDDLEPDDQLAVTLASYNVGQGHIEDAMKRAVATNRNPSDWDELRYCLAELEIPEVYQEAKYGYCRGRSVVAYVEDVLHRFEIFKHLVGEEMLEDITPELALQWIQPDTEKG